MPPQRSVAIVRARHASTAAGRRRSSRPVRSDHARRRSSRDDGPCIQQPQNSYEAEPEQKGQIAKQCTQSSRPGRWQGEDAGDHEKERSDPIAASANHDGCAERLILAIGKRRGHRSQGDVAAPFDFEGQNAISQAVGSDCHQPREAYFDDLPIQQAVLRLIQLVQKCQNQQEQPESLGLRLCWRLLRSATGHHRYL